MELENFYFILSILVVILSVVSVFVAWSGIQKGLTHSTMFATVWTLSFFAIARIWHTIRELFSLGDNSEMIEYIIYIVAFTLFITLAMQGIKTPTAKQIRKKYNNG